MPPKRKAASKKTEEDEVEKQVKKKPPKRQKKKKEESSEDEEEEVSEEEIEEEEEEEGDGKSEEVKLEDIKVDDGKGHTWRTQGTLTYFVDPSLKGTKKIAGFDMDHTLIYPKSKGKFPKNRNDWAWWDSSVPEKLKELDKDGYRIVIFSNQAGVEKKKQNVKDLTGKISDLMEALKIPLFAFLACATDHWRKPNTTMWDFMESKCNGDVKVDKKASFYVGDAAGRPKNWQPGKPKDIHAGDRAFAFNLEVDFKTPEEFFLGEKPHSEFDWGGLDPKAWIEKFDKTTPLFGDKKEEDEIHSKEQEMVLMVGCPASGKSTFSKKYFVPHGYVHVNQDTLKTKDKCLKVAKQAVGEGKSVVIDNTNGDSTTRAKFIEIANNAKIPVRCFHLQTPIEVAHHLNFVREKLTNGKVRRIPDVAYNMFKSKYSEPKLSEGIKEIRKVNFVPTFETNDHEKFFLQRTSD